ncbi:T9SS type A sorting domain-containing protein [candidate division KSB1 bacterium]|nr:T9SS type A sorting domain-containing protein [candidate division KSB1 bacterium]
MNTFKQNINIMTLLFLLCFLPSYLFAQVGISSDDLLGTIGNVQGYEIYEGSAISVDVGDAGENQTWDFRNISFDPLFSTRIEFTNPSETEFAGDFSSANLSQKVTSPSEPDFELYNYYRVEEQLFIHSGMAERSSFGSIDSSFVEVMNDTITMLPMQYLTTFETIDTDTLSFTPVSVTVSTDTTISTFDAWGTVRLPSGDYQCLRLKNEVISEVSTAFNGVSVPIASETYIEYIWISKDNFQVMTITSQDGETNPNFTQAVYIERMSSIETSVAELESESNVPTNFQLSQNYPNPFNSSTMINFTVPEAAHVQISVYDMRGTLVRTIVDGYLTEGNYSRVFDAVDLASGTYMYEMQIGDLQQSKKMIYLK